LLEFDAAISDMRENEERLRTDTYTDHSLSLFEAAATHSKILFSFPLIEFISRNDAAIFVCVAAATSLRSLRETLTPSFLKFIFQT
jgi:hypothetical protein